MSTSIEVVCGPMYAGKSEEVARRIKRNRYARKSDLVYKPIQDVRVERSLPDAIAISSADQFVRLLEDRKPDLLAVDEAQFFGDWIVQVMHDLRDRRNSPPLRIIIAGLDMDFRRKPFGPMPQLLALADQVTKLSGVCMKCGAEQARFTQILRAVAGNIQIGDRDLYEVRCNDCHYIP